MNMHRGRRRPLGARRGRSDRAGHASLTRLGVSVTPMQFARVGIRVVIPALSAAFMVLLVLRPVVGG
jgi:hypothetical protein